MIESKAAIISANCNYVAFKFVGNYKDSCAVGKEETIIVVNYKVPINVDIAANDADCIIVVCNIISSNVVVTGVN